MASVSLRLPDEVSQRLDHLAELTGRSKTFYMVEAIREHLDDLEDLYLAEQRLIEVRAGRSKTHTLEEVERDLGLAEIDDAAKKDLTKLDKPLAKRITTFLRGHVAVLDDPRSIGEALKGSKLGDFWKYHVGDYRIISNIEDGALRILVVKVGNRREVCR